MSASALDGVPPSIVAGVALGACFALVATALFALGERLFPNARASSERAYAGEDRRRTEIRDYLEDIGERYAENHPVAGAPVAFYLPERDVAVTFDAHAYFRIRNATDTRAVLVEHEMPARQLGSRLPFEVPERELEPADFHERVRRAYEALGLPTTATPDEVTAAYRERVKEVHPDHGGDEESFREVREAYVTAKEHAD